MSEPNEIFDQILESLELTEEQKKILIPKANKNRSLIIRIIKGYGIEEFNRGRDSNIEFLQT